MTRDVQVFIRVTTRCNGVDYAILDAVQYGRLQETETWTRAQVSLWSGRPTAKGRSVLGLRRPAKQGLYEPRHEERNLKGSVVARARPFLPPRPRVLVCRRPNRYNHRCQMTGITGVVSRRRIAAVWAGLTEIRRDATRWSETTARLSSHSGALSCGTNCHKRP